MNLSKYFLYIILSMFLLSCAVKGPLYFSDSSNKEKVEQKQSDNKAQINKEK